MAVDPRLKDLVSNPKGRVFLSRESPEFFDTYYCGMRSASHRSSWFNRIEEYKKRLKGTNNKAYILQLAPRDHGKTEFGVTFATREICLNRNIKILWISESQTAAEKRLRRVSTLLQSDTITADFGQIRGKDKWNENQIYVTRDAVSVDPTLEAVGSGCSVTGGHFNIIICDDLEDDQTTYSATERKKTRNWFFGTVLPMLSPGGIILVIGTRKHNDDLYGHLMKHSAWSIIQDPAIETWPKSFEYHSHIEGTKEVIDSVSVKGESRVLWPEERPIEYLLLERSRILPVMFAREFQHQVQDEEDQIFKWEWLNASKDESRSLYEIPRHLKAIDIVQGWDLSLVTSKEHAENKNRDFTVGVTLGRGDDGKIYLLGLRRARGVLLAEVTRLIFEEFNTFKALGFRPASVAVEKNAFGEIQYDKLASLAIDNALDLPLYAHYTSGSNKNNVWEGVPSLSAMFQTGKISLPYGNTRTQLEVDTLISEFAGLGVEAHDDCVMAFWIASLRLRKGTFKHQVCFGGDVESFLDQKDAEESKDLLDVIRAWGEV